MRIRAHCSLRLTGPWARMLFWALRAFQESTSGCLSNAERCESLNRLCIGPAEKEREGCCIVRTLASWGFVASGFATMCSSNSCSASLLSAVISGVCAISILVDCVSVHSMVFRWPCSRILHQQTRSDLKQHFLRPRQQRQTLWSHCCRCIDMKTAHRIVTATVSDRRCSACKILEIRCSIAEGPGAVLFDTGSRETSGRNVLT